MVRSKGFRNDVIVKHQKKKKVSEPAQAGSDPLKAQEAQANPRNSTAAKLMQAFALQMQEVKKSLREGEAVLLSFGEESLPRALQQIDMKLSDGEAILITVTWSDGEQEQRLFTAQNFQPVLSKDKASSMEPETVRMMEQVLGHLTAQGVLFTQMLAGAAQNSGDAKNYLTKERERAVEIVKAANIAASNMNDEEIRAKALSVVMQTFDSIQINDEDETVDQRVLN